MDAIEKRARELLEEIASLPLRASDDEVIALIIAALTPPEGHVVVTRNEAGQAVAVTRQDDEGRILSVIAELEAPEGYVLVPVELVTAIEDLTLIYEAGGDIDCKLSQVEELLAARPEVP
ncbi:hypothetical protein I5W23_06790 [Stenotrophomonas maltophilia]|nr:hypothetical protein [Stenotrophomonas maltophilia]